jgi:putative NADH-flavin reductase
MTIALFGASGRSGAAFIPRALAAGHSIRALARTPDKVAVTNPQLTALQGDVTNAADVARTIEGCEVVVSLIGQTKGGRKDVQTVGTRHMVDTMQKQGIDRIVSMSGGGLPYAKDEPKFVDKAFRGVMGLFFKDVIRDATDHADVLRRSGLNWTIVRAPRLVEESDRGEYKVGYVGTTGGSKISRGDVADFILQVVEQSSYRHDMPFISW